MKKLVLTLCLTLGALAAWAQRDSVYLKIFAEADADSVRNARFFEQAKQSLQVELSLVNFAPGGSYLSEKRYLPYVPYNDGKGCGCWQAKVAKNALYQVRYNHPGFEREERMVNPEAGDRITLFLKSKGNLAKTYGVDRQTDKYEPFYYTPGTLNFSETIVVFFKDGEKLPKPSENAAFLKEKALKELQKTEPDISVRHVAQLSYAKNAFYVTLGLPDRRTMEEFLYWKEHDETPQPRGYYQGADITKVIETLLKEANVERVVPVYYDDAEMAYRTVDPNDYPKSKRLQRKIGDIYYEYETMLEELEKKLERR